MVYDTILGPASKALQQYISSNEVTPPFRLMLQSRRSVRPGSLVVFDLRVSHRDPGHHSFCCQNAP